MEGLHRVVAVVGLRAQPYRQSAGKSIDQVHHGDLRVLLLEVVLVDANRIDPKRHCPRVMSPLSEERFEVFCHLDLVAVDGDVFLSRGVAPCV